MEVDVRDGHLTVRVVDVWGPGRVPLVVRSYTNTASDPAYTNLDTRPPDEPEPAAPPYNWQFNQMLDIVGGGVLEPDGNRSTYRYSHDRWNANQTELWQVYVKDVGTYSTMEIHFTCSQSSPDPPPGDRGPRLAPATGPRVQSLQAAPSNCTWDGSHVIYLPKGAVQIYSNSKLVEERDANGNTWRYAWTTFTDGVGQYLSTATDPIGRQTAYAYERGPQTCTQWSVNDRTGFYVCTAWRYVYRLRTVTDPYGRTATYFYDGTTRKITSVTNAAGFTTSYTYVSELLAGVTNSRGFTTSVQWDGSPRVTRVTAPDATATAYAYTVGTSGRVTRTVVTDARGHATTYDLYAGTDANYFGNVERVTDPL